MELTALIMDNRTKKVKQFSLLVEFEYVASEFGYVVEELGIELSREQLERYLDYEKYGRDVRLSEGGSFVDKGYFVSR